MSSLTESIDHLLQYGYVLLPGIFGVHEMLSLADRLSAALHERNEPSVLRSRGRTYGSRNLLETFPQLTALAARSPLADLLTAVLGPNAGMVRALYFDKPPDRSWSLPWHRDRTISVKRHDLPSDHFDKPTFKAGVPHVEAPPSLLANMLTLRIHLDPMTEENGPLSVIPTSHRLDQQGDLPPVELHANAGDVLVMRPLLSHASSMSRTGTTLHRRIIHLEFAACGELPDQYEWYSFVPVARV